MTAFQPYGLLAGNWCPECGQPKMNRLLYDGMETGCATCDEVTTRHRCASRPDIADLSDTQSWQCPDCGTIWWPETAAEACPDCCGECGHEVIGRRWRFTEGDRVATAPRYVSPYGGWWPMRNLIASTARPDHGPQVCHVTANGISIHVRPGCRCPRRRHP